MSIEKMPPSYGVPDGPLSVPLQCIRFASSSSSTERPEVSLSFRQSRSSCHKEQPNE